MEGGDARAANFIALWGELGGVKGKEERDTHPHPLFSVAAAHHAE